MERFCLLLKEEAVQVVKVLRGRIRRFIDERRAQPNERNDFLLSPYTLHRREDYFPQPERFDPERFTPEREKQLPRYAYLPFGAGPRICIGNHFAMMEGHLLLATLAQRTSFHMVPGQTIEPDPIHHLVLRPGGAVNMSVKKR